MKVLDVSNNNITSLSEQELAQLTQLQRLVLTGVIDRQQQTVCQSLLGSSSWVEPSCTVRVAASGYSPACDHCLVHQAAHTV